MPSACDGSGKIAADWPFQDAYEFPDEMWSMIEVGRFEPGPISHFVRVLWFHFDFGNGGLVQVMYNLKKAMGHRIEDYARSFEELGLASLGVVVRLADQQIKTERSWKSVFSRPAKDRDLDLVYHAIAYAEPGTYRGELGWLENHLEGLEPVGEDGDPVRIDWVARAALKYAREHRSAFEPFAREYGAGGEA